MKIIVRPSVLEGSLSANPSKSYMQRALALTGLSGKPMVIDHPCKSADSMAAMEIVQNMGFKSHFDENSLLMTPAPAHFHPNWHAGESGLSARIFSVIASLFDLEITISGKGSLLGRPMQGTEDILVKLGVKVHSNQGFLPLRVKGPIHQSLLEVDAANSSQELTGLLITLPFCTKGGEIHVKGLKSRPYIEMTLEMLQKFGIEVWHKDLSYFRITGRQQINTGHFTVEGDWSGAAFILVAGAISGKCVVRQLNTDSMQGDKNILGVLKKCGTTIETEGHSVTAEKKDLNAFEYFAEDTPDLFPPLVALASHCRGSSKIHGISRLFHKESNRFEALQKEFGKLQVDIQKEGDSMLVQGGNLRGGQVYSHQDHRIAMSLFVAGLAGKSPVIIDGMECITKSYPNFLNDMTRLKADYSILEP